MVWDTKNLIMVSSKDHTKRHGTNQMALSLYSKKMSCFFVVLVSIQSYDIFETSIEARMFA